MSTKHTAEMHTPGPWKVEGEFKAIDNGKEIFYVGKVYQDCEAYRGTLCHVQSADHIKGISRGEAEANARLIASAPDLLAGLRGAMDNLALNYQSLEAFGETKNFPLLQDIRNSLRAAAFRAQEQLRQAKPPGDTGDTGGMEGEITK